ncbi:outer membrane protein assembly factor BamE [Tropicimonas sp.]|uniref:outer membrane protein assembly factor BamE n=1 Tax=Tropicimonas sp. TaxID=2067044 RepID=UPI003A857CEE
MSRQDGRHLNRAGRALGLCAVVLTGACTSLYQDHGYTPSDSQLAEIDVGVDTRNSVAETVGPPTTMGALKDSGYYYVSQRMRTYAYREPEIIERQVVAISFDRNGVVSNIERFGLEKGNVVALSRRVTESNIEGVGFLAQLMGNVGMLDIGENIR